MSSLSREPLLDPAVYDDDKDFREELIAERAVENPEFPAWFDAAVRRRRLLHKLAAGRQDQRLSRTAVAARMSAPETEIESLEYGEIDLRLSTLEKYALAIGKEIEFRVKPAQAKAVHGG